MYASSISAWPITRYTAVAATAAPRGRTRAERRGDRRASATVTSGPSGVDRERQCGDPRDREHLQHPVAERDLLGLAAVAGVDVHRVAQHGDHERHDRH